MYFLFQALVSDDVMKLKMNISRTIKTFEVKQKLIFRVSKVLFLDHCLDLKNKIAKVYRASATFLATESTFKMMKNAFYFILGSLLVLKIFEFLS